MHGIYIFFSWFGIGAACIVFKQKFLLLMFSYMPVPAMILYLSILWNKVLLLTMSLCQTIIL